MHPFEAKIDVTVFFPSSVSVLPMVKAETSLMILACVLFHNFRVNANKGILDKNLDFLFIY